jgi:hypothetical protein
LVPNAVIAQGFLDTFLTPNLSQFYLTQLKSFIELQQAQQQTLKPVLTMLLWLSQYCKETAEIVHTVMPKTDEFVLAC